MSRPSGARVFIGNLSNRVSDREVEDKFSKYGRILKIDLKNGYGFVEYEHERDASDAIHGLNGADMDGMRVKVEHAKGPRRDRSRMPARSPENRVIVENIHHSVTWQTLKDYMRKAGDVMFADVVKDRGAPYGVVEFRTYDEMKRAIRKLDNTELNGSYIYMKEVLSHFICVSCVLWLVPGSFFRRHGGLEASCLFYFNIFFFVLTPFF
jgi:arginine/serine-rich splicing factor 4/5/6